MKRPKLTKDLIRKHFGKRARIRERWFADGFEVTTDTGEVLISKNGMTVIYGGEDIYRAMILLGQELWGKVTARGNHEHLTASVAHGEAWGVNVIPEVRGSGAGCLRLFVAFWVLVIGLRMTGSVTKSSEGRLFGYAITAVLIGGVWGAMKKGETRAARKRGQRLRNIYPRTQGTAVEASGEDLERGDWI